MKKLSLATYNIYELKRLDFDHTLKIKNMLNDVEDSNVRLLAPLATFIYLGNHINLQVGPKLYAVTSDMFKKYPNISEENALKYLKNSQNIDLKKYYESYTSENQRRDENDLKNKFRKGIKKLQKEKNISNYKICKLANVDMGNFHSFYELNKNERLSVNKLEAILNVCINL